MFRAPRNSRSSRTRRSATSLRPTVSSLEDRTLLNGKAVAFLVSGWGSGDIAPDVRDALRNDMAPNSTENWDNDVGGFGNGAPDVYEVNWNGLPPGLGPITGPNAQINVVSKSSGQNPDPFLVWNSLSLVAPVPPVKFNTNYQTPDPFTPGAFVDELANYLDKNYDNNDFVALIGHSLGGNTVLRVANELKVIDPARPLQVDLLATLDPVGWSDNPHNDIPARLADLANIIPGFQIPALRDPPGDPNGKVIGYRNELPTPGNNVEYFYNRWQTSYWFPFDEHDSGWIDPTQVQVAADSDGNLKKADGTLFDLFGTPIRQQALRTDELDALGNVMTRPGDQLDWVFGTSTITNLRFPWQAHWFPELTRTSALFHGSFSEDPYLQGELIAMLQDLIPGLPPKVNTPPVAGNDVLPLMGSSLLIGANVLANDADSDGTPLRITGIAQPPPSDQATLTDNGDGTYTFQLAPDYSGETSFQYNVGPTKPELELAAGQPAAKNEFGRSVAISGDWAVVGAPYADAASQTYAGAAYVFRRLTNGSWGFTQELTSDRFGAAYDYFGTSVAISGNTLVVGAPGHDSYYKTDSGIAYVFELVGNTWVLQGEDADRLGAGADAVHDDHFGTSVAISGDTIVVGAPDHDKSTSNQADWDAGAAYVFEHRGGHWNNLRATLVAPDTAGYDHFGTSVAISGNRLVVGIPGDNNGDGSAWEFELEQGGGSWVPYQKLVSPAQQDRFGTSVAIDGNTLVVGAPYGSATGKLNAGTAYVFEYQRGAWARQSPLTASDAAASDYFGVSVAISGDTLVVGAFKNDPAGKTDAGAAYVFDRQSTSWVQRPPLAASDAAVSDQFGYSVAISGDTAIIGANYHDTASKTDAGTAYIRELGTATTTVIVAPVVESAVINDDAAQRSMVKQITIAFGLPVGIDAHAIDLEKDGSPIGFRVGDEDHNSGQTVVALIFPGFDGNSLPDGQYTLTIDGNGVHQINADGTWAPAFGSAATRVFSFHRLYGDTNGDGDVDASDFFQFRAAYGTRQGGDGYLASLDVDGDGDIDASDLFRFRANYGKNL